MKLDELISLVPSHGVFRRGQILAGQRNTRSVERQLDRWVKSGRILQVRRGVYVLTAPYVRDAAHPFLVANLGRRASYVSLESALAHYGMIPEYVPVTTSVTTGRTELLDTPLGRFQYRHVLPRLFGGFSEEEIVPGQHALIASPGKALIDLLYLSPHSDREGYLRELRVVPHADFADETVLHSAGEASGSKKVMRALSRLLKTWREEGM